MAERIEEKEEEKKEDEEQEDEEAAVSGENDDQSTNGELKKTNLRRTLSSVEGRSGAKLDVTASNGGILHRTGRGGAASGIGLGERLAFGRRGGTNANRSRKRVVISEVDVELAHETTEIEFRRD